MKTLNKVLATVPKAFLLSLVILAWVPTLVWGEVPAVPPESLPAASVAASPEAKPVAMLTQSTANIIWLIIASILVFFMQAGFAMVETGLTRTRNACNILMKNTLDCCMGTLAYLALGYCLMFGVTYGIVGFDSGYLFMNQFQSMEDPGKVANWFFQVVFAATAATIVSGAMAERTRFGAYVIYSIVISSLIYPVSGHWIWGGGWLSQMGFRDFAGSTVVHSLGGWAALAGAVVVGPRKGKYDAEGNPQPIPGHNMPLACLGVFILWFSWFGFNAGSTLAAVDGCAHVAVTTMLAACAGGCSASVTTWLRFGKPDLSMTLNGILAGLVSITAGCASVDFMSAVVIGTIGGILVVFAVLFIENSLRIDDPVGAISVHGICGTWGTLAVGFFGSQKIDRAIWGETGFIKNGLFYGGGFDQLIPQIAGAVAVAAFGLGSCFLLFTLLKNTIGLRVSEEEEVEGLDIGEHGNEAYVGFQLTHEET